MFSLIEVTYLKISAGLLASSGALRVHVCSRKCACVSLCVFCSVLVDVCAEMLRGAGVEWNGGVSGFRVCRRVELMHRNPVRQLGAADGGRVGSHARARTHTLVEEVRARCK